VGKKIKLAAEIAEEEIPAREVRLVEVELDRDVRLDRQGAVGADERSTGDCLGGDGRGSRGGGVAHGGWRRARLGERRRTGGGVLG
jgi:hypothetical protein